MGLCTLFVCGDNFYYSDSTVEIQNLHYHRYINKIDKI